VDEVRLVGRNDRMERDLYLSIAHDLRTWAPDLSALRPFAAFCALDADAEDDKTLAALASRLMAAGCHHVCAWGPDCERVHDIVDGTWIRENPASAALPVDAWDPSYVMTTWHDDEPLDEALWFAVFSAYVDEHDLSKLLAVASPQYAEHIERLLADTEQLSEDVT
jgi:hypothetical protein